MASRTLAIEQPGKPPAERRRLFVPLTLALILVAGLLLRLQTASTRSIWFDEAWSWRMSRFPLAELIEHTAADVHPPLYYLLLKAWTAAFGDSPLAMRSLSALFGVLTILAAYDLIRQVRPRSNSLSTKGGETPPLQRFPVGAALLVAALVAFSVFQIRYGWEARMYALGTFLYAASGAALFRAVRASDKSGKWWAVYGALIVLFAYTHYFALLSIAAQGFFLAGYFLVQAGGRWRALTRDPQLWLAFATYAIFLAALLPWASVFLQQLQQVHDDFWPKPVTAWSLPVACYQMFVDPENASCNLADAAALALACSCGLAALLWKARALEWYVFCGAVLPCAVAFLLGLSGMRVFYVRYLVFAHLAILTGLGLVVWRIPFLDIRLPVTLLLLANFAAAQGRFAANADPAHHGGVRAAAAYLAEHRRWDEPVVVSSPSFYFPLQYYLRDGECRLFHGPDKLRHYQGAPLLIPGDDFTAADIQAFRTNRVWIVYAANGWGASRFPTPSEWVYQKETAYPESFAFQGEVVVVEYDVPGG
jgi:mannosyltransferase